MGTPEAYIYNLLLNKHNNMNKTTWIIVAIVIIIGGIYLITRTPESKNAISESTSEQTEQTTAKGRVVFSVTDAAVNMGSVSELNMTVDKIDVHNSTKGWFTVSTIPKTYNLLALKASGESKVLADVETTAYTYDQVRLTIGSVLVKTKTGVVVEAVMPSHELLIDTELLVDADRTSSANFDFIADKSLHTSVDGKYIFTPVVKTETRSKGGVAIATNGTVTINGGQVDDTNTRGMDLDGSVKLNFEIKSGQKLNIGVDSIIENVIE